MNNNHNGNNRFDAVYFKNYLASAKKRKLDVKELLLFLGSLCFVGGSVWGITYLLNNKPLYNESNVNDFTTESSNPSNSYIYTETKNTEEEIVPIVAEETDQTKFLTEAAPKANTFNEKADLVNCYTGSYAAGQGDTQLDFTITDCDSDYNADALFLFYASDSNPSVPTGSYKMKGSLVEKYDDGSLKMYFEGTEWIQQPSTYGFVDFTAIVDPNNGTISSPDYSIELFQKNDNMNNFFNGHQYCLFNAPMNAEEAEITCNAMGGHLVSINSSEEQQHFEDIIKNSNKNNIWTGGYYDGESWIWTDGSDFVYSNWDDEKPDNYWGDEYYIKIATRDIDFETWSMYKNKWDDVSKIADGNSGDVPTSSFGFVCEWNQ